MQTQVCVCAHTRMYACMHNTHTHTQHTRILLYCFPLTRGAGHPRAVHAREDLVQLNYRDYSIMTSQSAGLKKILKPRSLCTARNRSHATPLPSPLPLLAVHSQATIVESGVLQPWSTNQTKPTFIIHNYACIF